MTTYFFKTALTGGTAASLDGIDGDELTDGDFALAMVAGVFYPYLLNDDAGGVESSPTLITPDDNAGDKRWILQSCYVTP